MALNPDGNVGGMEIKFEYNGRMVNLVPFKTRFQWGVEIHIDGKYREQATTSKKAKKYAKQLIDSEGGSFWFTSGKAKQLSSSEEAQ